MATYSTDRRSLLRIIGVVGSTCAFPFASEDLFGQTAEPHQHPAPEQHAQPRFLNGADFACISRIADLIIPETVTPGAVGAGVPAYIDRVIAGNTDHQSVAADGLRWLDNEAARLRGRRFVDLSEADQLSILEPLCAAADADPDSKPRNVQFFRLIKSLTADGYYTSRIGLMDELGYAGNKARPDYPACERKP